MFDSPACVIHVETRSSEKVLRIPALWQQCALCDGGSQPLFWHCRVVVGRIFQKETVPSHTSLSSLQSSPTGTNISNPCYPRGYSTTFDLGHVFGSLCTEKQRPKSYSPSDTVTFTGTGDPWLCRERVASVFDFKACQEQDACSFDGVYQPKVQGPFVVRPKTSWQVGGLCTPGESPSLPSFLCPAVFIPSPILP